jgi:glycosyltransferase involved in cell wall biosynthesis
MYGGGQRVVLDLLECGRKSADLDIKLALLGCREAALKPFADDVVVYDGRYNRPRTLLGTARRLRSYLRAKTPSILHTHGWDADIIGWLAISGTDIKQICHLHLTPDWLSSPHPKHVIRRWLTKRAFARPETRVVAVAEAVRDHWHGLLRRASTRSIVILNGADVHRYRPSQRNAARVPTVGTAARLVPSKGIDRLLQALRLLADEDLRPSVRIAGHGPVLQGLRDLTRCLGLEQQVVFAGHVGEMSEFHRSIDVFVLPSLEAEGLPIAVLEAMATGLPILTTRVGGASEVVRDGKDGFVVAPGDVPALAAALRTLLIDAGLRERMGKSARRRAVEELSVDRFAESVFDLYRDMSRT